MYVRMYVCKLYYIVWQCVWHQMFIWYMMTKDFMSIQTFWLQIMCFKVGFHWTSFHQCSQLMRSHGNMTLHLIIDVLLLATTLHHNCSLFSNTIKVTEIVFVSKSNVVMDGEAFTWAKAYQRSLTVDVNCIYVP